MSNCLLPLFYFMPIFISLCRGRKLYPSMSCFEILQFIYFLNIFSRIFAKYLFTEKYIYSNWNSNPFFQFWCHKWKIFVSFFFRASWWNRSTFRFRFLSFFWSIKLVFSHSGPKLNCTQPKTIFYELRKQGLKQNINGYKLLFFIS